MDSFAWRQYLGNRAEDLHWHRFLVVAERFHRGERTAWAMELMRNFVQDATGGDDPGSLPEDTVRLSNALESVVQGKSQPIRARALHVLRLMIEACPELKLVFEKMPRWLRKEPGDVLLRQRRVVISDSVPKSSNEPVWAPLLWENILLSPAATGWKTSSTGKQMLCMIRKFLRATGWMDGHFESHEDFSAYIKSTLDLKEITDKCRFFMDTFCSSSASAKRYLRVYHFLFVSFWKIIDETQFKITAPTPRHRVARTLEELDAALSSSSAGEDTGYKTLFFTEEEEARIVQAALGSPRDHCIITILRTTGLRRRGVTNLLISDLADRQQEGEWKARDRGQTLTKGRHIHRFVLHDVTRKAIERWLNTPEAEGGRMQTPSKFLFPSSRTDDGQMSVSALTKTFRNICIRAGMDPKEDRLHLHAMRHTCAHRLAEKGNTPQQIAAQLGHKSSKTTEGYLRDSHENIARKLVAPVTWGSPNAASEKTQKKNSSSLKQFIEEYRLHKRSRN